MPGAVLQTRSILGALGMFLASFSSNFQFISQVQFLLFFPMCLLIAFVFCLFVY